MRDSKLIVYGSSYDRGLEHLLKMWPKVKEKCPEAKLRIFYGWNLYDMVSRGNPQMLEWKEKMNGLMEQDGITHLGRISHEAVKKEFENAGIWAYPTHFGEISCITAMKAQLYGAVPVVVDYAALKETVQHGIKIDGDIYDQETKDAYLEALVGLLNDPERQEKIRKDMQPWAKKTFGWNVVAKQWSEEFKKDKSVERRVTELMEDNQPLKAWELVKDSDSELKQRVYERVKHAFDPQAYKEYYSKELKEVPIDEAYADKAEQIYPRYSWAVPRILTNKPRSVVDLGCADGYLPLTLASKGIESVGVNLYGPSVKVATERAKKMNVPAKFVEGDLFDYKDKHDCVVMQEVLEHLPDPQKGVDHAMSLLNDGGRAFFSTPRVDHIGVEQHKNEPNHKLWYEDSGPSGHLRLFTEAEFRKLFKNYKIIDLHLDEERCMNVEVSK